MNRFYGGLALVCVAVASMALAQESDSPRSEDSRTFRGNPPRREGATPRRAPFPAVGLLGGASRAEPGPAGKVVSLELVILEANKAGKQKPAIDLSDAEKIPELLRALEEKGEASVISRVRLSSLEHNPCSVQVGESRPVATGRTAPFGRTREGGIAASGATNYQMTNVGMMVQVTSRVEDDGSVIAELQLSSSRLVPAGKADDDAAIVPQRTTTLNTQTTLRIPKGRGTIVSASQSAGEDETRETLVLISAHVESSPVSADSAKDNAAAAESNRVLTVYALRFASAEQTAKLLQEIADFPLQASADLRTNSLIVRVANDNRDEVSALIERLDAEKGESPKE